MTEYFTHNMSNSFCQNLKRSWDCVHDKSDVFRYSITKLQERIVGDYLLQLNPDRGSKRRLPEDINSVTQSFDPNKFNFTKVSSKEMIHEFFTDDCDDRNVILVNVSPISRYHSLLCPSVDKCLPQIITEHSLVIALDIMFMAENRNMRIGFNSLCGFASVNHLHYHIFIEAHDLPIENQPVKHIKGLLYTLDDRNTIVPGFCYQIRNKNNIKEIANSIYRLTNYFIENNIAHNLMISRGDSFECDNKEVVRIIVWPRVSNSGMKQFSSFNVAICELSGWFPVYDEYAFERLGTEDIEKELRKWAWPNFNTLCDKVADLY